MKNNEIEMKLTTLGDIFEPVVRKGHFKYRKSNSNTNRKII